MRTIFTLSGIDEAIDNLAYTNEKHIKTRIIRAIRQFYSDENSVQTVMNIRTDDLIRLVWDKDADSEFIQNQQKNFSSIKSSINADLTRLHKDGKNPEGIIIGKNNAFDMSDKAKSELLENFSVSGDGDSLIPLGKINDVLGIVNDILNKMKSGSVKGAPDNGDILDQIKELIQIISQKIGISDRYEAVAKEIDKIPEEEIGDDLEEVDEDDVLEEAELEEIPKDELEEVDLEDDKIIHERLLAEEFDNMLSEMDRYYNQHILIPKGKYLIGCKDTKRNNRPPENVSLNIFYFGKFPVTNALFEIFIEKTGYKTTAERLGHGTVYYGRYQNVIDNKTGLKTLNWNSALESKVIEGACWYQPNGPGSTLYNKRNHPVVQVSIEDVKAFAEWTGKRIPTESQWEAATRTLKGYQYPWGEEYKIGCCNIEDSYIGDTTPVDKYPDNENGLGIMDSLGNVMEWTIDKYRPSSGEKYGELYIIKGGSWISDNDLCLYDRSFSEPDATSNILGFRCIVY